MEARIDKIEGYSMCKTVQTDDSLTPVRKSYFSAEATHEGAERLLNAAEAISRHTEQKGEDTIIITINGHVRFKGDLSSKGISALKKISHMEQTKTSERKRHLSGDFFKQGIKHEKLSFEI